MLIVLAKELLIKAYSSSVYFLCSILFLIELATKIVELNLGLWFVGIKLMTESTLLTNRPHELPKRGD